MKQIIIEEPNDFWKDEDAKISQEIAEGKLNIPEIANRAWQDMLAEEVRETKAQIFETLSKAKKLRWISAELDALLDEERRVKTSGYDQWVVDMIIESIEKQKKDLHKVRFSINPPKLKEGEIGDSHIQAAKAIPMDQLITFNRAGFAKCLWHDERTPSMKWFKKNNIVKCFGCQQRGDPIDVVMHQQKIPFIEAVKLLIN